ncbi:MAG: isochorismatase family protein [Alicyclobacillus herbarius]|uniref:cysteine hydrolase family protein n=1 Tax=Alicyclobacillus herbarius TaxID=122960 RepID=UPI0004042C17|nr:isochorismatase family protein [Alicyclobacillus herbarius]MCL6631718.1 isochorismatase family protein [Alicyclobacillus herbarius]
MKKGLILLDVQEEFLRSSLDYVARLCQKFLNQHGDDYAAIILTRWVYDELEGENTLLLSHPRAYVVEKSTYSGYTERVRRILLEHAVQEVHVAGVDSELSVLATMFSLWDAGYSVKVLERLCASYHGRNWEAMMIARHAIGNENVIPLGGDRVYL